MSSATWFAASTAESTAAASGRRRNVVPNLFERLHDQLGGGSWLCGRVTAQEFARGQGAGLSADRSGPAARELVRATQAAGVGHLPRCPRQGGVAPVGHRRRCDPGHPDRGGARLASGRPAQRRRSPTSSPARPRSISPPRSRRSIASSGSSGCCWRAEAAPTARCCAPA